MDQRDIAHIRNLLSDIQSEVAFGGLDDSSYEAVEKTFYIVRKVLDKYDERAKINTSPAG